MSKIEYENKLNAAGFEKIGSGLYSNVFAKPNSDKVVKVGRIGDDWPAYIRWAVENGYAGNFAPKVFSLKFRDDHYVAVMERLVATMREFLEAGSRSDQYRLFSAATSFNKSDKEKEALETASDFEDFFKAMKDAEFYGDTHDGNVMIRSDGQLVVTDPVAAGLGSETFRIKSGQITAP